MLFFQMKKDSASYLDLVMERRHRPTDEDRHRNRETVTSTERQTERDSDRY